MKLFPAIAICFLCSPVFCQHIFYAKCDGGLSRIAAAADLDLTIHKNSFSFSGQEALVYNMLRKKRSLYGAELVFVQITGKERSENYESGIPGDLTGSYFTEDIRRIIYYFGIPVYYGFRYKKLNVNLGFQTLFTMKSRGLAE